MRCSMLGKNSGNDIFSISLIKSQTQFKTGLFHSRQKSYAEASLWFYFPPVASAHLLHISSCNYHYYSSAYKAK